MREELQKIVDFTNMECMNLYFRPVLVTGYSGTGSHPMSVFIDGDILILDYIEQDPLDSIRNIQYGYIHDEGNGKIKYVYVDSIEDVEKYINQKRAAYACNHVMAHCYGSHFPFYEVDKIGGGFVTIETENERYEIYYPTKRITIEEEFNKED